MNPWPCKGGMLCPGHPWCDTCSPNPRAWVFAALKRKLRQLMWVGGVSAFCLACVVRGALRDDAPPMPEARYQALLANARAHDRARIERGQALVDRAQALTAELGRLKTARELEPSPFTPQALALDSEIMRNMQAQAQLLADVDRAEKQDPWPSY